MMYGVSPYIADYLEQVLISGIIQGWCPKYVSTTTLPKLLTQSFHDIADVPHPRMTSKLQEPQDQRSIQMQLKKYSNWGDLWDVYRVIGKVEVRYWHYVCHQF